MSELFSIDCHACGAKNTIDTETMRRVDPQPAGLPHKLGQSFPQCACDHCYSAHIFGFFGPEDAA